MTNGRPTSDELLSAYHDGELSAADRDAVERLLADSADARAELEDYRALSEQFGGIPKERAPADLRAAVLQRIQPPRSVPAPIVGSTGPRRLKRGLFVLSGIVTAAAGLLLGFNVFDGRFGDRPNGGAPPTADAGPSPESTAAPASDFAATFGAGAEESGPRSGGYTGDVAAVMPEEREHLWHRMAGDEGRPPEDALPGDIYRYLEQTDAGNVVVVEATVVDVREALDQVQVLLTRNSIPTMPVGLDAASAPVDESEALNGEFGVYVESDPLQMNKALMALDAAVADDPQLFLGFQVSGVLDTPPVATIPGSAAPRVRLDGESLREVPALESAAGSSARSPAAPGNQTLKARSRFSLPAEATELGAVPSPATSEPRQELGRSGEPAPAKRIDEESHTKSTSEQDAATFAPHENGYQQIVQFSKQELESQLRLQEAASRPFRAGESKSMIDREKSSRRSDVKTGASVAQGSAERRLYHEEQTPPAAAGQRRLRLLLVLEAESQKTKADISVPPVEAPRPVRNKS